MCMSWGLNSQPRCPEEYSSNYLAVQTVHVDNGYKLCDVLGIRAKW